MAYAYKNPKSGAFIGGWKDRNGKAVRKTIPGVRTLTEARRAAEDMERREWRIGEGLDESRPESLTVVEGIRQYMELLPVEYASRKDVAGRLKRVAKVLGEKPMNEVTPADVMKLLAASTDLSPQTREHLRMAGQGLYTRLTKARLYSGPNPFKETEKVRVPRHEVKVFAPEHLPKLFEELKPHHRAIALFGALTACRKGEVRVLLKEDVHLAERYVLVRRSGRRDTTKGNRDRRVPIAEVLVPVLQEQLRTPGPYLFPRPGSSEPFGPNWRVHEVIRRACARAGLPKDLRFKTLRATWATQAVARTGDLRLAQLVLGHADPRTTADRYARALPEHLQKGAEVVADVLRPLSQR
ncbi:tyrosine-type recombinase/integrase [Archangium lansingense]|uniref:tyrosine-type recombinase/integrase n=1 Tax=Archangium lansingense TaxID=2995310 RepID=UPI003B8217E0